MIVTTNDNGQTLVRIVSVGGVSRGNEILVEDSYYVVKIKMTDCADTVEIFKTADSVGSVLVYTKGGDDDVVVGNKDAGADEIYKKVMVHGGNETTKLVIDDSGSATYKENARRTYGSIYGILSGPQNGRSSPTCKITSFEGQTMEVNDGVHCYRIMFQKNFYQQLNKKCSFCSGAQCSSSGFTADYKIGDYKSIDTSKNKEMYGGGSACGTTINREGTVTMVTDTTITQATLEISEPETCKYVGILKMPPCDNVGVRESMPISFDGVDTVELTLNDKKTEVLNVVGTIEAGRKNIRARRLK